MSTLAARFVVPGVLFLLTLVSGVWLTHSGKPLNVVIMAVHKIIALVTTIGLVMAAYRLARNGSLTTVDWIAIAVAGLLGLLLFVSGALLAIGKPVSTAVVVIHKVTPVLTAIATVGAIVLLAGSRS